MQDRAIQNRADAKAFGAVTALSTRVNDRWKESRASDRTFGGKKFSGTSECISYAADGTATVFKGRTTKKPNRVPSRYSLDNRPHRITAANLAPIGDQNH